MASKKPATAPAPTKNTKPATAPAPTPAVEKETKVPLSKMRGPRGVAESATIKLVAATNPKRDGSKAHAVFSCYEDGMTVGEFCDAVDAHEEHKGTATPNLVYDAAHGFIKIEGYEPPAGVIEPKPKAEKKAAAPKAEPKGKAVERKAVKAKVEEEAVEEVVD